MTMDGYAHVCKSCYPSLQPKHIKVNKRILSWFDDCPYNSRMNMSRADCETIEDLLDRGMRARLDWKSPALIDERHEGAVRLFHGFVEGCPDLVVDLYGQTLVLYLHVGGEPARLLAERAAGFLLSRLPWVQSVVLKIRQSPSELERRGVLLHGQFVTRKIREHGVWYALDLTMNLDASLYLDTRELRAWIQAQSAGKRVLNAFAYTGSLGVAAMAGGACQVIQLDVNRRFLNLGKDSYALNGFPVRRQDFRVEDFWTGVSGLLRAGDLFDLVIIDPPFFSQTGRGRVDLVSEAQRVINKIRPLVAHDGQLVAINNALFLSGADYLRQLEELCAGGYLAIEALVPVPPDCTGFPGTIVQGLPANPAPFNHATKIAVLRVKRKDGRTAGCHQNLDQGKQTGQVQ